jgi:hypothetical protein
MSEKMPDHPEPGMKIIWKIVRVIARTVILTFMAVVVLGAAWWGWGEYQRSRLEREVSETRQWDVRPLPLRTPVHVNLKTRCAASTLYYILRLTPRPPGAPAPSTDSNGDDDQDRSKLVAEIGKEAEAFNIIFFDKDGFRLFETQVKDFITRVDSKGRAAGLEINSTTSCDPVLYRRVSNIRVGWNTR